ncbi:MAG: GNAT family N-acetyltransferase [Clostridia bacterium]|nr:GNAT family N-acetyltransferase [Clostridia bacterium]
MAKLSREKYIASPMTAASLAFWKEESFTVPEDMLIVREHEYRRALDSDKNAFEGFTDEPYFKLVFRMEERRIEKPELPRGYALYNGSLKDFAEHIRLCYGGGPDEAELEKYKQHPTHDPSLWLMLADEKTGAIAASGIAELDGRIGEGILEWIQVSPAARRSGLGRFIVSEFLWRIREKVVFVTVSGKLNDDSNPLALYKSCGFGGMAVWHILRRSHENE